MYWLKKIPVVSSVQGMKGWMLRCRLDDVRWIESCSSVLASRVFSSGIVSGEIG